MRKISTLVIASACLLGLLATPSTARAQGFVSGSIGAAFGGDTPDDKPVTYGGAVGGLGANFGAELDFTYTPDFFSDSGLLDKNAITTVMGNVLVGPRLGRMQPYVTGGLGLMRLRVEGPASIGEFTRNDFAMNAGGGIIASITPHLGLRGDIRYFRNLNDNEEEFGIDFDQFNYWRSSVGIVIKF